VDSAFVKAKASLERRCEKQPADVPALVLREVGVETPLAPPVALRTIPEHHLRRVTAAHDRKEAVSRYP
jgi:hypothetical protein